MIAQVVSVGYVSIESIAIRSGQLVEILVQNIRIPVLFPLYIPILILHDMYKIGIAGGRRDDPFPDPVNIPIDRRIPRYVVFGIGRGIFQLLDLEELVAIVLNLLICQGNRCV